MASPRMTEASLERERFANIVTVANRFAWDIFHFFF